MNTKIAACSVIHRESNDKLIDMLSHAAEQCLHKAEIPFHNVELLINSSLYSEDYISEPAVASLVQNRLNKGEAATNQFSLDLHSAGGGVIQAMQIADAMIKDEKISSALIIAGDAQPQRGVTKDFTINNGAGAILLAATDEDCGFRKFHFDTYEEYMELNMKFLSWNEKGVHINHNENEKYAEKCTELTLTSIKRSDIAFISEDITLACTPLPDILNKKIRKELNINTINHTRKPLYSCGVIQSLAQIENINDILFVNAGPGITISLAHYIQKQ